jgi:hypothetical protein
MANSTLGKRGIGETANLEREVRGRFEIEPEEELINLKLQKVNNEDEEMGPLFIYNPTTKQVKNILGELIGKRFGDEIIASGNAYDKFYNSTEIVTPNYVSTNRQNWKEARPGEITPYFKPYISCSNNNRFCQVFLFYKRNNGNWYDVSMKYRFDGFSGFPRGVSTENVLVRAGVILDDGYSTVYEAPPEIAQPYLNFLGIVNPTLMTLYALENLPPKERELDPFVKSFTYPNLRDPVAVRARGENDSSVEHSGKVELPADIVSDLAEYIDDDSEARIGGKRKKRKSKRKCRRSRKRKTRRCRH